MAKLQKEKTHKFLEITDPKKAVGLWSYHVVRETAMTPVGNTAQALGRFLNGDIVRWEHRAEMAEALVGKGAGSNGRDARSTGVRLDEEDTLVDAKTARDFKLDEPIKVTDDFKEAVAREFRRIAYTGTMGWRQKLNRPAHEVAVGIWLAGLSCSQ